MKNTHTLEIQRALKAHGFDPGHLDGYPGPRTVNAVKMALAQLGSAPQAQKVPGGQKYALGTRSVQRLNGVHPDLVKVVKRAIQITDTDFTVGEGLRTKARQVTLVKQGKSKTMNSRHLTGHAVDLHALDANGKVSWDWPLYHRIAKAMKQASQEVGVPVEWGGDWQTFKDGPHWQLPWSKYPK